MDNYRERYPVGRVSTKNYYKSALIKKRSGTGTIPRRFMYQKIARDPIRYPVHYKKKSIGTVLDLSDVDPGPVDP